jgi:hypothetical protein
VELQVYQAIAAGKVSFSECKEVIDLDEFLKLHALVTMENDIQAMMAEDAEEAK